MRFVGHIGLMLVGCGASFVPPPRATEPPPPIAERPAPPPEAPPEPPPEAPAVAAPPIVRCVERAFGSALAVSVGTDVATYAGRILEGAPRRVSLVIGTGEHEGDAAWTRLEVTIEGPSPARLAVQGPNARVRAKLYTGGLFDQDVAFFRSPRAPIDDVREMLSSEEALVRVATRLFDARLAEIAQLHRGRRCVYQRHRSTCTPVTRLRARARAPIESGQRVLRARRAELFAALTPLAPFVRCIRESSRAPAAE